jgi:hypothetical protein
VSGLSRKLGPLKLWQWIGVGVVTGVVVYVYRQRQAAAGGKPEESFGGTGTGAFGPINPDTGVPYAFESGFGGAAGAGAEGFGEFLEKVGQIKDLFVSETQAAETAEPAAKGGGVVKPKAKKTHPEHQHTKKPGTTGGAAAAPHTHHSPPHPITRVGGATIVAPPHVAGVGKSHPLPAPKIPTRHWISGHWQGSGKQRHWVSGHYG